MWAGIGLAVALALVIGAADSTTSTATTSSDASTPACSSLSYQRDPAQFITLQRSLSSDLMNEYIRHVGTGIWAIPPGAAPGSYVGSGLFA